MIVLGVDPGFDRIGWSVGQIIKGKKVNLLSFGLIKTDKSCTLFARYGQIDQKLTAIINEFQVQEAAIESLFFFKNQKTVIQVAEARGVIISSLLRAEVNIYQYSPPQIKMAVTGYGRSDKQAIEKMIRLQLNINREQKIVDDTFDSLAILLTHASCLRL